LDNQHGALRRALRERHDRLTGLPAGDDRFEAEYEQLVAQATHLLEFEKQIPARLAEPQRQRSERFVRWSWRGQLAVAVLLIVLVFVLGHTAWWLVLLIPHLLATLIGSFQKVTTEGHRRQCLVTVGMHVVCLMTALVSLSIISAWFIVLVLIGWLVTGVAAGAGPATGGKDGEA
jgi:hypothetical protein